MGSREACWQSSRTLSKALDAALQCLVSIAGGWSRRGLRRRPAYQSVKSVQLRGTLAELHCLEHLTACLPPAGP